MFLNRFRTRKTFLPINERGIQNLNEDNLKEAKTSVVEC